MTKTLAILALLLLAACSGSPPTSSDLSAGIDGDMPTNEVLIYRPNTQGGETFVPAPMIIMVDDNNVGNCDAGTPLLVRLPKGRWTVTGITANDSTAQQVTVNAFDTAYFRCDVARGSAPTPMLVRVTRAVAVAEGGL